MNQTPYPPQNPHPQGPHGQGGWPPREPQGPDDPPRMVPAQQKTGMSKVVIILLAVIGAFILLAVVIGVVAFAGMRSYLAQSKMAEGRVNVGMLARGIVACSRLGADDPILGSVTAKPGLPPTSPKVPSSLTQIRGAKYTSLPSDWTAPAFKCASFNLSTPQYFQYQWVLETPDKKGTVRAEADLDGDGAVDVTFEEDIECSGPAGDLTCTPGALREKR